MRRRRVGGWLIGSAALRGPTAWAQGGGQRKIRLAILFPAPPPNRETPNVDAFKRGLLEHRLVEGENVEVIWRFVSVDSDYLAHAQELAALKPDVIITAGTPAAAAAKQVTQTIPVVMASGGDPVGTRLVTSLARPGGNLTGLSSLAAGLDAKRLSLIRELLPSINRLAVLSNPANPLSDVSEHALDAAARPLGITLQVVKARDTTELGAAFVAISRGKAEALVELPDNFFATQQRRLVDFALTHRIPTMHHREEFVTAGGLMSYGANLPDLYRRSVAYVEKILSGIKPADLPIEQPRQFDFVLNLRAAEALRIMIPASLRLQATRILE